MSILNYILTLLIIGLLNIKDSSPARQNFAGYIFKSINNELYRSLTYKLKSSDSNFNLTNYNDSCLEFDQDDNDNSNHYKNPFIRLYSSEKSKIIPLREKKFIPKKSSSYFELDLPPPLIS